MSLTSEEVAPKGRQESRQGVAGAHQRRLTPHAVPHAHLSHRARWERARARADARREARRRRRRAPAAPCCRTALSHVHRRIGVQTRPVADALRNPVACKKACKVHADARRGAPCCRLRAPAPLRCHMPCVRVWQELHLRYLSWHRVGGADAQPAPSPPLPAPSCCAAQLRMPAARTRSKQPQADSWQHFTPGVHLHLAATI